MTADIIELDDRGLPGAARTITLVTLPRVGELIVLGEQYFEVANIIHTLDTANPSVSVFVRSTKPPYQEPKSSFGFGGR